MELITNLTSSILKYKGILFPALLLLVAGAILFFVGFKSFNSLSDIKENILLSQDRLSALSEKRKNLEIVSGMAGVLDDNLFLALDALPEKDEISALLSQIQQISGEAGVYLNSLQYTGASKATSANAGEAKNLGAENGLFAQTMVTGSYSQLIKFLELLENARRIVSFESLRLGAISKEDLTKLNVSLSITGYYLGQEILTPSLASGMSVKADFRSGNLNKVLEKLRGYKKYENINIAPVPVEEQITEPIDEQPLELND